MKIDCQIMYVDGNPNRNGRIYTNEIVNDILKNWKNHTDIIFGIPDNEKDKDICGKIENVYLDGDILVAEGELFDSHNATNILKQLYKVRLNMYIVVNGYGCINMNDGKTVEDYELVSFNLSNSSSFDVLPIRELKT